MATEAEGRIEESKQEEVKSERGADSADTLGRVTQLALEALPAIGSLVGFVGFVAVLGGAIQWVRFWAAGLPADQAMRVVPRPELVAIGAVSLVGFLVAGLLAVLLVYLLDRRGDATLRTLWGLVMIMVAELLITLIFLDVETESYYLLGAWFFALGVLAGLMLRSLPDWLNRRTARKAAELWLCRARRDLEEAEEGARRAEDRRELVGSSGGDDAANAQVVWVHAQVQLRHAQREWDDAVAEWRRMMRPKAKSEPARPSGAQPAGERDNQPSRDQPDDDTSWLSSTKHTTALSETRLNEILADAKPADPPWKEGFRELVAWGWPAAALIGILVLGVVLILESDSARWLAAMLLVVGVLGAATFLVARATGRFAWYGIAVFVAVVLYGAALNISRTVRDPKVQPAALVRKSDDRVLCGVYVTQTDDRVYLGRVQRDGKRAMKGVGRMFWVPVSDVDVVTVGPLQAIGTANRRAAALVAEVSKDRAHEGAQALKPNTTTTVKGAVPRGQTTTVVEAEAKLGRPSARPMERAPEECASPLS